MAKRRRLDKRFLRILAVSAMGLVALGFVALKLRNRFLVQHPEKFLAAGREALAKKDYADARDNLMRAAALSHPDADLDVAIGDALNGLSDKDPDNVAAARGMWEQALTTDATNASALDRLIHFWHDEVDLHPRLNERAQAAQQWQKTADKLVAVDPDNLLGQAGAAEATLEALLDGVAVDAGLVKTAEDTLIRLEPQDPASADMPYYVARAYLYQGAQAGRTDDPGGQARFFSDAQRIMAKAEANQPDNADIHYEFGRILLQIAADQIGPDELSSDTQDDISQGISQVDQARQLATPDDAHYIDINLYDAKIALERPQYAKQVAPSTNPPSTNPPSTNPPNTNSNRAQPKPQTAGHDAALPAPGGSSSTPANRPAQSRYAIAAGIYKDVLTHRPNDPATRIAYAELLGNLPGHRDEAIALLAQPLVDDRPTPGIKGTLLPVFQAEANMRLLSIEIDAIESARVPARRATLMAQADTLCDRVYGRNPNSATVLGMKGRLQLLHNRVVEATQTLQRALQLTDPQDPQQQRARYELIYNLAEAEEVAQQTGDAKRLVTQIVSAYSTFIPARLMLARLLITEHDFTAATPQIDYLESILPAHPELSTTVLRMRIATLDPVRDAARLRSYFDRLPEGTRDEKMDKAALARLAKLDGDALRLQTLVHAQYPGDVDAASDLADWYHNHGQNDKARQVLSEALAVNPTDSGLQMLQMQVDGKTLPQPGSAAGNPSQPGAGQADAFSTEVAEVQYARAHGDMAGVDQHLAAAEKLRPDDPRIWDAMFTRAMDKSDWDRASLYLEKLAAANVDHADGLLYRVHFALAKNDTQKALDLALQLTRDKPEFSQSWCLLAQVQKAQGNLDDAVANFQQALNRQTQNLEAIHGLVDCSYATGNVAQAKKYIDLGRRVAPANDSFKELALSYELTYGDPQNVIGPRLEANQAHPENPQTWLDLASAYIAAGRSRSKAQDATAAADYNQKGKTTLQKAIAKFPDDPQFVGNYAKLCVETGDFPSAEQAMLNFTGGPGFKGTPRSANLLADFYELAGKPDQAAKVLSNYLASPAQPTDHSADVGIELHLAGLLARQKQFDQALAVLSANAQDPAVVRQRVSLLINAGRLADAEKVINDQAALAPLAPDLLTLKGVAAMGAPSPQKLEEARDCFDQVIAAQPNNVYALTERARVALRAVPPNYSSALADLSRARDLAPTDMDTRLLMVDVDRHRGQPDDAIRELESALRLAPADKRVRLTLIDLYAQSNPPRWSDADQLIKETRQISSLADDADFLHEQAQLEADRHDYSSALTLIQAAMAKAPGSLPMVHTYYDILLKTSAYDQLLAQSTQLLASSQNSPSLWWVYPYRAEATLRGSGDRAGAAAELERGINATVAIQDGEATAEVSKSYATLLGFDAAIKVAAARAQNDPHWLVLAADLCRQKGDSDAAANAIGWLETALGKFDVLSPQDQDLVLRMAAAQYLALPQPDTLKSADMYRRIIKRNPDDIDSLNNLACILVENGPACNPGEALHDSERAYNLMVRAGQDEPLIKDTYGWTLIANDRSEQGLNLISDALSKLDFAEGHYHLAEGLLKRQPPNSEDAASELTKAMQMLDQDERDGKPVDDTLRSHVQDALKQARSGLAG
jgi:tetratricopeptide (TPR) repeat protein